MPDNPLKKLLPKFVDYLKEKGRSPSTILAYGTDLEQLTSFLERKNTVLASQVRPDYLEGFKNWLLAEKYTPKSTSRKLNAIKTFFRWLKTEGLIAEDPSKDVRHPKIEVSVPKFLSQLEYRALRDIARTDLRVATIVEVILQTGMRISEVANLKLANIKGDQVVIEAYATQPQRTIPLNRAGKTAIDRYLQNRIKTNSPYVFVSKNGKPLAIRNIRAAIDRYLQKAEISGYSVNDLRTTFIVENLRRGVNLITISQAVGHKRLSTTERYLELAGIKEPGKKQVLEEL